MRFTRTVVALIFAVILWSCGSGGLFNLNPQANGNIVVTNSTTGATLQTTLAQPFSVSGGAFSIGITEDHFSGPYTVSVTAWTAPFNESCYVAHYIDQTDKTNIVKFSADNAAPVTAPTQPSPCNPFTGTNGVATTDEETVTITDGRGHKVLFYYKMASIAATGGGSASVPTHLAVSWSGPSPAGSVCGAYALNVSAVNAAGRAVATTAANPITLTTTGGAYMGFSVASSASAAFTCTGSPPTGSPGGTPSLQLTTSPGQVLVYFNGYSAAATTTITVNSVGLPPVSLTISNAPPPAPAKLAVSWSGASPTGSACGAYVLSVSAVDATGKPVTTGAANPITLSTTGGGYMGFSVASSGSAPFTCTGSPPVGSPGGTPSLQLATSPGQVLVYFNGYAAAATTTITVNSVGVPPVSLTISNAPPPAPAKIAVSWSGASPTASACGAYVLSVSAVDATGKPVATGATNPITLSTTAGDYMGFSVASSGSAAFTCTGSPPVGSPGGTPSLQLTTTPAQVLVYFNGYAAAATTTITVNSVGLPPVSLTISNAAPPAPAKIAASWSGASPTASACGAYVLSVSAVDATGKPVATGAANPITLSTTGGGYMGFSVASSGSAFTCTGSPPVGSPGGTPSLQLTTTPAQVLVYYNGYSSAATTTITVNSVGLPPVTITLANAQSPVPASITATWSGPSPTGNACGAYVLNVGALGANGNPLATTAANPITLSTTGGGYMGFSVASSSSAGFTCPQSPNTPPVGSPGGTPSFQLTATPAQVLVYYNGFSSGPTTTITASSTGVTPAPLTIVNNQSTTVASIVLTWIGVAPTTANCGAFLLNVQAKDIKGNAIVSSQYTNPITLSTNSALWSGFSTVDAGIVPAPPPTGIGCNITPPPPAAGGTPTLLVPDTATPTVVYYNGPLSILDGGGGTQITASAVGVVSPGQIGTISF